MHGHWHGQVGVAHYNSNGWQTDTYRQHDSMDWLVFCGTNAAARIYDDIHNVATKTAGDLGSFGCSWDDRRMTGVTWTL